MPDDLYMLVEVQAGLHGWWQLKGALLISADVAIMPILSNSGCSRPMVDVCLILWSKLAKGQQTCDHR